MLRNVIGTVMFALGIISLALSDKLRLIDTAGPLLLLICGAVLLRDREAGREPSLRRPGRRQVSSGRLSPYSPVAPRAERATFVRDGADGQRMHHTDTDGQTTWNIASTVGSGIAPSSCASSDSGSATSADFSCGSDSNV